MKHDPFRDDLPGALARVASLEAENKALRDQVSQLQRAPAKGPDARPARRAPRAIVVAISIVALFVCLAGLFAVAALGRSALPPSTNVVSPDFQGIAITPVTKPTPPRGIGPTFGAPAAAPVVAPAASSCRCAQGDPLCTCL